MPHNNPLTFRLAGRREFTFLARILFVLSLVAAALSPHPVFLTILAFGAGWLAHILEFSNLNKVELISVIFPDGQVRIRSNCGNMVAGFLSGQQWCSRHVAVLRYIRGDKYKYLVLLSAQQNADEYRRLNVWLRQDFCIDTAGKHVSGTGPAKRV
jgi:hypothetical protein